MDAPISGLIPALVTDAGLAVDVNHVAKLVQLGSGTVLDSGKTLAQSGVKSGEKLQLTVVPRAA